MTGGGKEQKGGTILANSSNDKEYRKKRVKRIKKAIIALGILVLVLPLILSIVLFCRMSRLEEKVDTIIAEYDLQIEVPEQNNTDTAKAEQKQDAQGQKNTNSVSNGATVVEGTKKVYLTFDDGPSKQTEKILDVLKEKNVKATFFEIGRDDEFSRKMYQRIVDEGHTLGMHSYSHIYQELYGSLENFQADFKKISEYFTSLTGVTPKYYRFPGGSSNSQNEFPVDKYTAFLKKQGVEYMDWNVIAANGTTEDVTEEEMVQSVLDGAARYDTAVVLMYDSADRKMTAKSLGAVIDALQEAGYELLPIDENTVPVHHS